MGGEYEPQDSRNVTGTSTNQTGDRWSDEAKAGKTPDAAGQPQQQQSGSSGQQGGSEADNMQRSAGQYGAGQDGTSGQQPQQLDSSGGQMGGGGSSQFAGQIREHMEVIGADGAHVGTVDHVDGDRIKLTKADSGEGAHEGHHHYLPLSQVSGIEGDQVRLAASGATAYGMEAEE